MNINRPTQEEILEGALNVARKRYAAATTAKDQMMQLAEIVRLETALLNIK